MLRQTHRPFALEPKTTFLWNSHDLHSESTPVHVAHEWSHILVRKRLKAFEMDPQTQDAPKGIEQRYPNIFPLPTKLLGHMATIDRRGPQQRFYQSLLRVSQGI